MLKDQTKFVGIERNYSSVSATFTKSVVLLPHLVKAELVNNNNNNNSLDSLHDKKKPSENSVITTILPMNGTPYISAFGCY